MSILSKILLQLRSLLQMFPIFWYLLYKVITFQKITEHLPMLLTCAGFLIIAVGYYTIWVSMPFMLIIFIFGLDKNLLDFGYILILIVILGHTLGVKDFINRLRDSEEGLTNIFDDMEF